MDQTAGKLLSFGTWHLAWHCGSCVAPEGRQELPAAAINVPESCRCLGLPEPC